MKGEISYYKILGVDENASNHELRKAFCKLSIELHPDTTSLEIDDAKTKFQEVLEAYENLNNSNLRKIYDDKLKEKFRSKNKNKVLNSLIIDSNNQNADQLARKNGTISYEILTSLSNRIKRIYIK